MVSWLTGVALHDHNCGMKCCQANVFREIRLYGELHRFIPVLAASRGFKVSELVIRHRPRKYGRSKYGVRRFIKGFLDLLTVKFLTGFGERPSHALGGTGLFFFAVGLAGMIFLSVTWIINAFHPIHSHLCTSDRFALWRGLADGAQMIDGISRRDDYRLPGRSDTFSVAERTDTTETK